MARARQATAQTQAASREGMGPTSGTFGGVKVALGKQPGQRAQVSFGDAGYLWIMVALEVAAIAWGRSIFSRHHGG